MDNDKKIKCFIHFLDGTTINFQFSDDTSDSLHVGQEIHNIQDTKNLCIELDGKLVFIPMNNIRTIEFFPSPEKLPMNVLIKGAQSIKE